MSNRLRRICIRDSLLLSYSRYSQAPCAGPPNLKPANHSAPAQNSQIGTVLVVNGIWPAPIQNGGYFAAWEALQGMQPSPGLTARRRAQSHGP